MEIMSFLISVPDPMRTSYVDEETIRLFILWLIYYKNSLTSLPITISLLVYLVAASHFLAQVAKDFFAQAYGWRSSRRIDGH